MTMLKGISGYGHGHADSGTEWWRPGERDYRKMTIAHRIKKHQFHRRATFAAH
jgi:hypothetical protein